MKKNALALLLVPIALAPALADVFDKRPEIYAPAWSTAFPCRLIDN